MGIKRLEHALRTPSLQNCEQRVLEDESPFAENAVWKNGRSRCFSKAFR